MNYQELVHQHPRSTQAVEVITEAFEKIHGTFIGGSEDSQRLAELVLTSSFGEAPWSFGPKYDLFPHPLTLAAATLALTLNREGSQKRGSSFSFTIAEVIQMMMIHKLNGYDFNLLDYENIALAVGLLAKSTADLPQHPGLGLEDPVQNSRNIETGAAAVFGDEYKTIARKFYSSPEFLSILNRIPPEPGAISYENPPSLSLSHPPIELTKKTKPVLLSFVNALIFLVCLGFGRLVLGAIFLAINEGQIGLLIVTGSIFSFLVLGTNFFLRWQFKRWPVGTKSPAWLWALLLVATILSIASTVSREKIQSTTPRSNSPELNEFNNASDVSKKESVDVPVIAPSKPTISPLTLASPPPPPGAIVFSGLIGKSPVFMELYPPGNQGRYFYLGNFYDIPLRITPANDAIKITEWGDGEENYPTGFLELKILPSGGMSGFWYDPTGRKIVRASFSVLNDAEYEQERLSKLVSSPLEREDVGGYQIQWWKESVSGLKSFTIVFNSGQPVLSNVNQYLAFKFRSALVSYFRCTKSSGGLEYSWSPAIVDISDQEFSVRETSTSLCVSSPSSSPRTNSWAIDMTSGQISRSYIDENQSPIRLLSNEESSTDDDPIDPSEFEGSVSPVELSDPPSGAADNRVELYSSIASQAKRNALVPANYKEAAGAPKTKTWVDANRDVQLALENLGDRGKTVEDNVSAEVNDE